ncbi:MAG TPA: class I SAM-dependent methyltransferase [Thermoanaerobaculia bacterium]|jgi:SAM-dependent methyltransferase|nr:class I SAM-dependent methyltransferase [Thermoanaerobaculia bacterium]
MSAQRYEEDLAYIHHVGFSGLARGATPWVIETLRKAGLQKGTVVELGCGSGLLLAALTESGYQAVGVDASAPILDIARSTAPAATLLHASLYEVEIPRCATVVAMGEGLNYVGDFDAPPPTADLFARTASALEPNGLLIFDVMVSGRDTTGPYRTWASGDNWACLVEVLPEPDRLRRKIITFRRVEGGYRRGEEEHRVHLFSRRDLIQQLEAAGFRVRVRRSYGAMALGPGRRLFLCRKS